MDKAFLNCLIFVCNHFRNRTVQIVENSKHRKQFTRSKYIRFQLVRNVHFCYFGQYYQKIRVIEDILRKCISCKIMIEKMFILQDYHCKVFILQDSCKIFQEKCIFFKDKNVRILQDMHFFGLGNTNIR